MTDNEIKRARYFVESDEDYITLLKKANKDLGDLVRLRDEQIATLTAERDKATQYWQIAEGRCDALKQQRDDLLAALKKRPEFPCSAESHEAWVDSLYSAIASVKEVS